jgi:hypothetical protein
MLILYACLEALGSVVAEMNFGVLLVHAYLPHGEQHLGAMGLRGR